MKRTRSGFAALCRPTAASSRATNEVQGFIALLITAPLAAFTAIFFWDRPPPALAMQIGLNDGPLISARFTRCFGAIRYTCVIDGDTFWYRGTKIRIADINAPELSEPQCASEAKLAERATERLTDLLNDGPFVLGSIDRERDVYGRALKVVSRNGESLGSELVSEGLAERWKGYRGNWC